MRAEKTKTFVRQEQIAEAAMELICAEGLAALSIAGIAERVGIVPSAVYRHYSGKEGVLDAVLALLRERMLGNVGDICGRTSGALERLRLLLFRQITMLVENPAFPHVIFAQFSQAGSPGRWSVLHDTMNAYLQEIAKIIRQGQAEGFIRREISPESAAVMFIGLIIPAAMLHRLSGGAFDPAAHVEAVWPVFLRGLTAEK